MARRPAGSFRAPGGSGSGAPTIGGVHGRGNTFAGGFHGPLGSSNADAAQQGGGEGGEPVNTELPEITGTPEVGEMLAASPGTWTEAPTGYSYRWFADDVEVDGATTDTYGPIEDDEGTFISVGVVAENAAGEGDEALSQPVGPISQALEPGGPNPAFVSNFADVDYKVDDVSATLSDIWVEDLRWGVFDPARITEGVGLRDDGSYTSSPVLAAQFTTTMLATGFTFTVDWIKGAEWSALEIGVFDPDGPVITSWRVNMENDGTVLLRDNPEALEDRRTLTVVSDLSAGPHRIAFTFANDELSASVDGGAVQTIANPLARPSLFYILLDSDVTVTSAAGFDRASGADLPALSA